MGTILDAVPVGRDQVVSWGPNGAPYELPAPQADQERLAKRIGPAAFALTTPGVIRCDNALAEARQRSDLGLEMWSESLAYQLANDDSDPDTNALRRAQMEPIALAVAYEIKKRERLRRQGSVPARTPSRQYEALKELIAEVKAAVTIVDFIESEAPPPVWPLIPGKRESHSPCLLCGGRDRFVITNGPPSLGWCRRCDWGCDIISYAATCWRLDLSNGDHLREVAVRLAREYLAGEPGAV